MPVAFVFSGGASLGAVQAGMLQSLTAAGIKPDMVLGTSVGAMNAAFVAGGGTDDELAAIWNSLRGSRLFPVRPLLGLRGFLGRMPNFVPNDGVRHVLERNLPFSQLEDAEIPLTVLATDITTGFEVRLSSGPAVDSILASTALPGVFPPIEIDGVTLVDGGIANNTPISAAIDAGADEVWVLTTGYSCGLTEPPRTAYAAALHSVGLLVQQRLALEARHSEYSVPVRLIPPPCPISVLPTDFSHSEMLIDYARAGTDHWLESGMPDALPALQHLHNLR